MGLCAGCSGVAKVRLPPVLTTVIDWAHPALWAWCTEILVGPEGKLFDANERELQTLTGLACRSSLAGVSPPGVRGFELSKRRYELMEPNARELVTHSHDVLAYLAFPVLEGTLKKV